MHFFLCQAHEKYFHCSLKILLLNEQGFFFPYVLEQKHFHYVYYYDAAEPKQFGIRKPLESVVPECVATFNTHSKMTVYSFDSHTGQHAGLLPREQ